MVFEEHSEAAMSVTHDTWIVPAVLWLDTLQTDVRRVCVEMDQLVTHLQVHACILSSCSAPKRNHDCARPPSHDRLAVARGVPEHTVLRAVKQRKRVVDRGAGLLGRCAEQA